MLNCLYQYSNIYFLKKSKRTSTEKVMVLLSYFIQKFLTNTNKDKHLILHAEKFRNISFLSLNIIKTTKKLHGKQLHVFCGKIKKRKQSGGQSHASFFFFVNTCCNMHVDRVYENASHWFNG